MNRFLLGHRSRIQKKLFESFNVIDTGASHDAENIAVVSFNQEAFFTKWSDNVAHKWRGFMVKIQCNLVMSLHRLINEKIHWMGGHLHRGCCPIV